MNFEKHFVTLLNFVCAHYIDVLSISFMHNLLTFSLVHFCDNWNVLCH